MGIKIYDIASGKFAEEPVCAEGLMRFLYGTVPGRMAVWAMFKRAFFSRAFGIWADSKISARGIEKFVLKYGINMDESLRPISAFKCWNDFFTRELLPGARPTAEPGDGEVLSFPCDGRHLLVESVGSRDFFYAKGQRFELGGFLGDAKLAERFDGGPMLISRLSPLDYHRYCYPVGGQLCARKRVSGGLCSVSSIALKERLAILWENKRVLELIDSPVFGMCAFVQIGATNVGTIVNFGELGDRAERGAQAGLFKFGGSCIVTLFERGTRVRFDENLARMSARGIECYARSNSFLGRKA